MSKNISSKRLLPW